MNELYVKNLPVDRLLSVNCQRIVVRRKHLLFDAMKYLKVTFVGEPAVDDGGPLREFFHLLVKNLSEENKLLCGPYDCRTPRKNIVEFQKNSFFQLGKMIAMSLVHGGLLYMEDQPHISSLLLWLTSSVMGCSKFTLPFHCYNYAMHLSNLAVSIN